LRLDKKLSRHRNVPADGWSAPAVASSLTGSATVVCRCRRETEPARPAASGGGRPLEAVPVAADLQFSVHPGAPYVWRLLAVDGSDALRQPVGRRERWPTADGSASG
jgi:hypothetical protein